MLINNLDIIILIVQNSCSTYLSIKGIVENQLVTNSDGLSTLEPDCGIQARASVSEPGKARLRLRVSRHRYDPDL